MGETLKSISVLGTVGVPAAYGGFETLADNLVSYAELNVDSAKLSVYCSGRTGKTTTYKSADLRYLNIGANGTSSILYDLCSLLSAIKHRDDVVLLLGVSGALFLPVFRLISRARVITNIDGIEWKREKWGRWAKAFLRLSEAAAVRFSHVVIADNEGIAEHVLNDYGRTCNVIAYGGDHAIQVEPQPYKGFLPSKFALALCRIEPENNVEMILEGFESHHGLDLVFVGNWSSSDFGRKMRARFGTQPNIHLLDPIYDASVLRTIRSKAQVYVHGHSAGGTNPSLVEMMHFGVPILAFDCSFNRHSTDQCAIYFGSSDELSECLTGFDSVKSKRCGAAMRHIAAERYTWDLIGKQYFDLLLKNA